MEQLGVFEARGQWLAGEITIPLETTGAPPKHVLLLYSFLHFPKSAHGNCPLLSAIFKETVSKHYLQEDLEMAPAPDPDLLMSSWKS